VLDQELGATEAFTTEESGSTSTGWLEVPGWVGIVFSAVSIVLPFTPWCH